MSLNLQGNPAGKIEIVIPVSPIAREGEKRLMKVELADLLASIPATNGALSAGVALLLKAVFTFGGRDDLDDAANAEIQDAVDMVLAGIAMYEPGEVKLSDISERLGIAETEPEEDTDYFKFRGYSVPKMPIGRCVVDRFEPHVLPARDNTPHGEACFGVLSTYSRQWVLNSVGDNCLCRGLPHWAEKEAAKLCYIINSHIEDSKKSEDDE